MIRQSEFPYGRLVIIVWFIPLWMWPDSQALLKRWSENLPSYWTETAHDYYVRLFIAVMLAVLVTLYQVNWRAMLGRIPSTDLTPALKLLAFLFLLDTATFYTLFLPLSYTNPALVEALFSVGNPVIHVDAGEFPVIPNLLSLALLVIVAPCLEEFTFRGLLLHRWVPRWGYARAIVISSLLFGFGHLNPIGATAFGIAMCVLYLQSRTLWLPILCHGLYNFIAWLIEFGYVIHWGPQHTYTLEDLRGEWHLGFVAAVLAGVWVNNYLSGPKKHKTLQLPRV